MKRFWSLALLIAAVAVLLPSPAYGHGESSVQPTNYRSEVQRIEPKIAGVAVAVDNQRQQLRLRNDSQSEVVVLGYEGEPYLRVGPDGVFANRRSPAYYLNQSREGDLPVPQGVDPRASPEWVLQSGDSEAAWHDHRIHRLSDDDSGATGAAAHPASDRWVVNLAVNGLPVEVVGETVFVPPPRPIGWLLAAVGLVVVLAAVLWRRPSLFIPALIVMVGIDVVHRAAIVATIPSSGVSLVNEAFEAVVPSLLAWGATIRAVRQLRRGDQDGWWFGLFGGLFIALISGVARISTFMYSQTPFALGNDAANVLVLAALAVGLAVAVVAGFHLRRIRRQVQPSDR